MGILSVRGLDEKALAALKKQAAREEASVNALVLRFIEQGLGLRRAKPPLRRHGDLDALAGSWSKAQATEFGRATEAFAAIDAGLWK